MFSLKNIKSQTHSVSDCLSPSLCHPFSSPRSVLRWLTAPASPASLSRSWPFFASVRCESFHSPYSASACSMAPERPSICTQRPSRCTEILRPVAFVLHHGQRSPWIRHTTVFEGSSSAVLVYLPCVSEKCKTMYNLFSSSQLPPPSSGTVFQNSSLMR